MAPDDDKRKTLAAEHLSALDKLERGHTFNTTHTIARELIGMGLASADWGRLCITEAGRIALRRPARQAFRIISEHVADIASEYHVIDPMTAPHLARAEVVLVEEEPYEPLPPASDEMQRAMRAAGVASGVTGVWVEEKWVRAFVEALYADGDNAAALYSAGDNAT